jgi:hypothetical protein
MITELCIPLTLKIMGIGRPLLEAERIAAIMIVRVVLLCAMMGYTISLPGVHRKETDALSGSRSIHSHRIVPVIGCGIFPAVTGTSPGFTRSSPDTI